VAKVKALADSPLEGRGGRAFAEGGKFSIAEGQKELHLQKKEETLKNLRRDSTRGRIAKLGTIAL